VTYSADMEALDRRQRAGETLTGAEYYATLIDRYLLPLSIKAL